ncbi:MAG: J domain-containing protein [Bacteriovoracaceae bacterium]|nr:J domain-containing protein [Bacteriovoracaceae bacterium]
MATLHFSFDYWTYLSLAVVGMALLFYFSRALASWLTEVRRNKKDAASSGTSFDRLVALKQAELQAARGGNPGGATAATPGRPSLAAASKQVYQTFIQDHPNEAARYRPVLELIENAAWGEGPRYREIRQQFKGHCGIEVELKVVARIVHDLLANDTQTVLALSTNPPPPYSALQDLVEAQIWHHVREHQPELLAQAFATRKNLRCEEVLQALADHSWNKLAITQGKHFISVMMLEEELKQAALRVALTRPLPDFKEINEDLAYHLLGAQSQDSATRIKKLYKQAALRYHPDRLAQRGGDVRIAQQNFAKIQQAYQFLKGRRKKAS